MSDIQFSKEHPFGKEKARTIIEEYREKYADQLQKFKIGLEWDGDTIKLSGPATGTIEVLEDRVDVNVKLGMMARMMKGTIMSQLDSGLERVMAKHRDEDTQLA